MRLGKKKEPLTWLVVMTGFALALWLRSRASPSVQETVAFTAAFVGLVTVNYWCVRLLVGYATSRTEQPIKLVARAASIMFLAIGMLGIVLCDIVSVSLIYTAIRHSTVNHDTFGYAAMSGVVGSLFAYGGAYELRIIDDRVDYFTLSTGRRSLSRQNIEHARVRLWSRDAYRPTNRLELLPATITGLRPIIINLKAFKKSDLGVLFKWLGDKLTDRDRRRLGDL